MTVSPGIFFFHIFKILTFCFVRGVKDKKWSKMTKNPVRCPPYPRNHISCDCQIWYTGKMIISPGIFFILSKCWFFGILGRGEAKGQKMAQNDKKLCPLHSISQEPYIICLSIMVRMCKMIISLSVSSSKFWFTGFSGGLKCKKGQKWQKRLSVAPYISGTYIIWSLFMVHICKMINISKCFFHFLIIMIFGIISGVKEQKMA